MADSADDEDYNPSSDEQESEEDESQEDESQEDESQEDEWRRLNIYFFPLILCYFFFFSGFAQYLR